MKTTEHGTPRSDNRETPSGDCRPPESSRDEHLGSVQSPAARWLPVIVLVVVALGAFLAGAWNQQLWSSREGRVASCAQGMIESGDWLIPRISADSEPRFEKPPLPYWLAAVCGLAIGGGRVTELAAKLPSVLAGLGTVLLIFSLGTRALGSRRAGILAALALVSTALFWDEAHISAADMPMIFFMVLAIFGFWRVTEEERRSQLDRMLPWLALGLGFLTKGPVALAVPLVAMIGYLLIARRFKTLPELIPSPLALIAFVLVALPWYFVVMLRHPEALGTWTGESLGRFDEEITSHQEPFLYYLSGAFWAALVPWVALLPGMLVAALALRRTGSEPLPAGLRLAAAWVLLGLLLFSLASSKRQYYMLALTPGFALAVGWVLNLYAGGLLERAAHFLIRVPLLIVGLLLLVSPAVALALPAIVERHEPGVWPAGLAFGWLSIACFAGTGLALTLAGVLPAARRLPLAQGVLVASCAVTVWAGLVVVPALNPRKSQARFCRQVLERLPAEQEVCSVDTRGFPLLAYYLGRNRVVDSDKSGCARWHSRHPEACGLAEYHNLEKWIEEESFPAKVVLDTPGHHRKSRPVLFKWEPRTSPRADRPRKGAADSVGEKPPKLHRHS